MYDLYDMNFPYILQRGRKEEKGSEKDGNRGRGRRKGRRGTRRGGRGRRKGGRGRRRGGRGTEVEEEKRRERKEEEGRK